MSLNYLKIIRNRSRLARDKIIDGINVKIGNHYVTVTFFPFPLKFSQNSIRKILCEGIGRNWSGLKS